MTNLAANLSMLFKEVPFLERFVAARKAGFRAVEYQYPYKFRAHDIAAAARDAGVQVVLHNAPHGDEERGEHGTACVPGREAKFRDDLELALDYAAAAGCTSLHCLAGVLPPDAERKQWHTTYIANLRYAAARLKRAGMRLLIEPLSAGTVANYFLTGSAQAVQVLDEVAAENAFLQYDVFHMQMLEGNLSRTLAWRLPRIGHIQIADAPGRNEPGTGEINFQFLLGHIDALGYAGWIGCEYNPQGDTVEGLKWGQSYLNRGSGR